MVDLDSDLANDPQPPSGESRSLVLHRGARGTDERPPFDSSEVAFVRAALLAFFREEKRDLPWRSDPDPYSVLVSEVMLQQTRVETVIPYFKRWIERFPDLTKLAEADDQEVLRAWQGLGYYSRARNLHRTVREVASRFNGRIPDDPGVLQALPGIGPYTAGAVASIAFGVPIAAVDGNARRVLARLTDEASPSPTALRGWATTLVDPNDPGGFNQALMELGAQICVPRSPNCGVCPVNTLCRARQAGTQEARPARKVRRPVPSVVEAIVGLVYRGDGDLRVLLRRRPPRGLLGGMWELPGAEVPESESPAETAMDLAARLTDVSTQVRVGTSGETECPSPGRMGPHLMHQLDSVDHSFTHRRVRYVPFVFSVCRAAEAPERDLLRWATRDQADDLPIGVAHLGVLKKIF